MTQSTASSTPSWLTVAFFSLLFSVITGVATVSVQYGRQEGDLKSLQARIDDGKDANKSLAETLEKWRDAYNNQTTLLNVSEARVQQLETDRCVPIKAAIDDLQDSIQYPHKYGFDEATVEKQLEILREYQQTLRACYASTGAPSHQ
jgi:inorganic pyrophosphatase